MKNSIFNFKLYKEGLKQSTLVAMIFISIMLLGSILIPVAQVLSQMSAVENGYGSGKAIVEGVGFNAVLIISFCLFAPLVTLSHFSFLNRRDSSDFYHSIPHRRETVYFSFVCSLLTWVIGAIWLCGGVSLLIYLAGYAYVSVNMISVLTYLFTLTAGAVLVMGAVLIAMSITGSVFSNIVTALLILFLPRLIIMAFTAVVVDSTPIITSANFGILGDSSYNMPFSFVLGIFYGGFEAILINVGSAVYSLVLGLIYSAFALALFKRRKSEMAGTSAVSPLVQTIIRVSVSFVACIIGCTVIISALHNEFYSDIWLGIVMAYGAALIVYFAYELITTKKLGNIAKTLPALGILVALNIAFIGGAELSRNVVLSTEIDASDVGSVKLSSLNDSYDLYQSYEYYKTSEITIDNKEIAQLLTEKLARDIEQIKNNNYYGSQEEYKAATIEFKLESGRTITRNIKLYSDEEKKLTSLLGEAEDFRDAYLNLPKNPTSVLAYYNIPEEAALDIYETLREEVRELDFAEWYSLVVDGYYGDESEYGSLYVTGYYGVNTFESRYPITTLTPLTLEKFVAYVNENNEEGVLRAISSIISGTSQDYTYDFYLTAYDSSGNYIGDISTNSYVVGDSEEYSSVEIDDDIWTLLKDEIEAQSAQTVDFTETYYRIEMYFYSYDEDWDTTEGSGIYFFNSDSEELLELVK